LGEKEKKAQPAGIFEDSGVKKPDVKKRSLGRKKNSSRRDVLNASSEKYKKRMTKNSQQKKKKGER